MLNKERLEPYIQPLHPKPTGIHRKGAVKGRILAVMFDIYGTLFISGSGDISIAQKNDESLPGLRNLMDRYSIKGSASSLRKLLFMNIEKKHGELKEKGNDFPEIEIDRIWMEILNSDDIECVRNFAFEYEMLVNPVYPMPCLKEMLKECQTKGIAMGVISNAQFFTSRLFDIFLGKTMEALGFHENLVFFSYQVGLAKPSPVLFEKAGAELDRIGIPPCSVLYMGNDMLNDIYPACRFGFQTALFAGDARSLRLREDDLRVKGINPDLVITSLSDICDFF